MVRHSLEEDLDSDSLDLAVLSSYLGFVGRRSHKSCTYLRLYKFHPHFFRLPNDEEIYPNIHC